MGKEYGKFDETTTRRLIDIIERHGHSITALSRALKSRAWLGRLLLTKTRPLTTEAVDLVLSHLGEPPEVLFAPVLHPGDQELLDWIERNTETPARLVDAEATFSELWSSKTGKSATSWRRGRLRRLAAEGLLYLRILDSVGVILDYGVRGEDERLVSLGDDLQTEQAQVIRAAQGGVS